MTGPRIVLLSSVNVGTRNRLSNADIKSALRRIGFPGSRPVLQSGNLIVEDAATRSGAELERVLERGLREELGLETRAFGYAAASLFDIASAPPWPAPPCRVHLFVHNEPIDEPGKGRLRESKMPTEELSLSERHFWLHAPDGLARSKIAARAAAIIGQPATARSLSSLGKILAKTSHDQSE